MKFCLVFVATLVLVFGTPVPHSKSLKAKLTASKKELEKFIDALHRFTENGDDFDLVNLEVNKLSDEILTDLKDILDEKHLNVIELRDEDVELPEHKSEIYLTNGHLEDMATVLRYDEISVDHNRDDRILTFRVPLGFSDLEFTYEYETVIHKEKVHGEVEGKIDHIKLDLELVYEAKHGFAVEGVHIHDRGELEIEFNGHNLDREVIDAIKTVVRTHLGPLVEEITEKHVRSIAEKVIESIDDFIHHYDDDDDNDDGPHDDDHGHDPHDDDDNDDGPNDHDDDDGRRPHNDDDDNDGPHDDDDGRRPHNDDDNNDGPHDDDDGPHQA
ncbi:uncharacterized protein [Euwallacea similis]|uniref:uncharacterized protein n=1 Tax=Euwallacea similis TaxID=1736056 RepID=UPI00344B9AF3